MPEKLYCSKCEKYKAEREFLSKSGERIYSTCRTCRRSYSRQWMRNRRTISHAKVRHILIQGMGGACQRCGYSRHESALEFCSYITDPDPATPIISIVNRFVYGPTQSMWDELMIRASGHALLCANCHKALRAGDWDWKSLDRAVGLQRALPLPEIETTEVNA